MITLLRNLLAIFLITNFLNIQVSEAVPTSACQQKGGPLACIELNIGNWHYSFNRCETLQGDYSTEEEALVGALKVYYTQCGDQHLDGTYVWGNPEGVQFACEREFPAYYYGVEYFNGARLRIAYCNGHDSLTLYRKRSVQCPTNYLPTDGNPTGPGPFYCIPPSSAKDLGPPCPPIGNPISPGTGNKYQRERDYSSVGPSPLVFERYYNSSKALITPGYVGLKWRTNFDRSIRYSETAFPVAVIYRMDGRSFHFRKLGSVFISDADISDQLTQLTDANGALTGWSYRNAADESIEAYDATGKLLSITHRNGLQQTLNYDSRGRLSGVSDPFGRQLSFAYDATGRLSTLTDPAGNLYRYNYDGNGNLVSVTYPDQTPGDVTDNPKRTYVYNESAYTANTNLPNALTGIIDENSVRFAIYRYDAQGRAISSEHAGGVEKAVLAYNANGTTTVTDALGTGRNYTFQTVLGVTKNTALSQPCASCGGSTAATTYDANGNISAKTDFNGHQTVYAYDLARNLEISRTEAVGTSEAHTITTQWHSSFRLPLQITTPKQRTDFSYDSQGNLLSRTETALDTHMTRQWRYTYNANGQVVRTDGPRTDVADITTYTYDNEGNLATTTNALGHTTTFARYDAHGHVLSSRDPNGVVTALTYDPRGRLLSRTTAGATTAFSYDPVGNLTQIATPDGGALHYRYDAAHRLIGLDDALGNHINYTLDALGNRTGETVTDPSNALTQRRTAVYDSLSRLAQSSGAAGQTTAYHYDAQGNVIGVTDPLGRITRTGFDALNRVVQLTDPAGGVTEYRYDSQNQVQQVTDPRGLITTYRVDGLGHRWEQRSPDTGLTTTDYDAAGNPIRQIDARNVASERQYDALNRLVAVRYPTPTLDVSYNYDQGTNGLGRLTGLQDATGQTVYSYDAQGRLISETRTQSGQRFVIGYGYDAADRLTAITYPSGRQVTYERDSGGQIQRVLMTSNGSTAVLAQGIIYRPFGPLQGFSYGNGATLTRTFDLDGRLTRQTVGAVQDFTLTYNAAGNVTRLDDGLSAARNQMFDYDLLDRLQVAQGGYGALAYTYDANGNRLSESRNSQTANYYYETTSNRLLQIDGATPKAFAYDAAGNTTQVSGQMFRYNDHNRFDQVRNSATVTDYGYDGSGRRVIKTVNGQVSHFIYNTIGQLLVEADAQGQTLREYFYLDQIPLAIIVSGRGSPATERIFDNRDTNFHTVGNWPASTQIAGFQGTDYQYHEPNGLPPGGLRIDNRDASVRTQGTWTLSTSISGYFGTDYATRPAGSGTNTFSWPLAIVTPGDYQVAVRWTANPNRASNAPYTLQHANGRATFSLDQRQNGGQWVTLGTFPLNAQSTLTLTDQANGYVIADAVRLQSAAVLGMTQLHYIHTDHLGTPKLLTNAQQQIVWQADYQPFGQVTLPVNQVENPLRFPGQYYDTESGLHYNYMRDYDPQTGRYAQSDPIGLSGGINTYVYVKSNPLVRTDSDGLRTRTTDWKPQDYFVCSYYDNVSNKVGCLYHRFAAIACRDMDQAVNAMVDLCGLVSSRQLNCIRKCLVREDEKARNDPNCQIEKDRCSCSGTVCACTKRSCVNAYHDKCYLECSVSRACYGGHYYQGFPSDGD